ncbi:MAG: glutathione S-transferase [Cellvibrionaceae bacterium]
MTQHSEPTELLSPSPAIEDETVLYSFRRCPYAMRARMALDYSAITLEHREILLKNKPAAMLAASPKGTVPVLILDSGEVIDESRDVMMWALNQSDPQRWYQHRSSDDQRQIELWINRNDDDFKPWLDKYKYSVGYPEHSETYYRQQAEEFIADLERTLSGQRYLLGEEPTLADNAVFPFVRQFAHVDKAWFDASAYTAVQAWLDLFLNSERFSRIMKKHPLWQER